GWRCRWCRGRRGWGGVRRVRWAWLLLVIVGVGWRGGGARSRGVPWDARLGPGGPGGYWPGVCWAGWGWGRAWGRRSARVRGGGGGGGGGVWGVGGGGGGGGAGPAGGGGGGGGGGAVWGPGRPVAGVVGGDNGPSGGGGGRLVGGRGHQLSPVWSGAAPGRSG